MNQGGSTPPLNPGGQFYGSISYGDSGGPNRRRPEGPPRPPLRIVTPIRIAILLFLALGAYIFAWRNGWFILDRDIRTTALVEVAPLQIDDTTSPLIGNVGVDADGYTTQYVDRAILRAMLARKRYGDLTAAFEKFQDAFEADVKKEYWIFDASEAFSSAEPGIKDQLDAWVMATPDSFAPYLARAAHWEAVGHARRGGKFVSQTSRGDLNAMSDAFVPARADLAKAISLRPKLVAARRLQMRVAEQNGARNEIDQLIADSLAIAPDSYQIRVTYLFYSVPKWGGTMELMNDFARSSRSSKNPKMRLLQGYPDWARAHIENRAKDRAAAMAAINRACAIGDNPDFLEERASLKDEAGDIPGAILDLDRAIALHPGKSDFLAERATLALRANDFEAAGHFMLEALRIDPTEERARTNYPNVVQGLVYQTSELHKSGNDKDALRVIDLGADLAPSNTDVQKWRMWILSGSEKGTAAGAAAAATAKNSGTVPDDIDEVRKMDYALAAQDKFADIVPLWDAYIAKHPNDGRAYLERGGTHIHLGERDLAGQDALKACDLGINEGCLRAHQLGL
ncbi:MAG: DUF4034 domain-containing protein [Polyangiaceae bacterium]